MHNCTSIPYHRWGSLVHSEYHVEKLHLSQFIESQDHPFNGWLDNNSCLFHTKQTVRGKMHESSLASEMRMET